MSSVIEITSTSPVSPSDRKKLDPLIKHYLSKKHPFGACVKDNTKRFGEEGAKKVCARLKDIGLGTTKWRKGGKKSNAEYMDACEILIDAAGGNVDGLVSMFIEDEILSGSIFEPMSGITALSDAKPLLTTVPDVQIVTTGIEYPLSSGPATFTEEDLLAAVASQEDPAIPMPRIWLGHADDERIHGKRPHGAATMILSGEPAVGKVENLRLTNEGHTIVGDLTGVPVWLANIMSSAFPSRSIEGRWNVATPTGHKWRLVITGLALLGVCWPGVTTLEDIAALYTKEGPDVTITTATPELPVILAGLADRKLSGQITVEDLRRMWYENNKDDTERRYWWLRSIYLDPNELIVDADDGATLYRQSFSVTKDKVKFGKPKKVKIKYVNAGHGGVEAEPINENREHIAQFDKDQSEQGHALTVNLGMPTSEQTDTVEVNINKGASR